MHATSPTSAPHYNHADGRAPRWDASAGRWLAYLCYWAPHHALASRAYLAAYRHYRRGRKGACAAVAQRWFASSAAFRS